MTILLQLPELDEKSPLMMSKNYLLPEQLIVVYNYEVKDKYESCGPLFEVKKS